MTTYYTILLGYVAENATRWHPTEDTGPFRVLSRGAFEHEDTAHAWAEKNIPGHSYSVSHVDESGQLRCVGQFRAKAAP